MREIDDRYPEYAKPYEPLRKGRRFGKLTGNEATLLARRTARREAFRRHYSFGAAVLIAIAILVGLTVPSPGEKSNIP
ncbi:MAG: hypothetical protein IJM18_09210, partial [Clostridia bacterium]|nr:hypothetical protein [Clostridia bacterium]